MKKTLWLSDPLFKKPLYRLLNSLTYDSIYHTGLESPQKRNPPNKGSEKAKSSTVIWEGGSVEVVWNN